LLSRHAFDRLRYPRGTRLLIMDRQKPGLVAVNQSGERFDAVARRARRSRAGRRSLTGYCDFQIFWLW
jgi:hypothetical protein